MGENKTGFVNPRHHFLYLMAGIAGALLMAGIATALGVVTDFHSMEPGPFNFMRLRLSGGMTGKTIACNPCLIRIAAIIFFNTAVATDTGQIRT